MNGLFAGPRFCCCNFFWCLECLVSLYIFLWFYFTVRCSVCLETLYVEVLWSLGCFSPEQTGICFCRYSPDSLNQIYSFSSCVCHSGGVNSGCHLLRRQVYHYMFSREHSFPLAQEKYDNAGIFLDVLCGRMELSLILPHPQVIWPFWSLRIIEVWESDDFYHKTLQSV